MAGRAVTLGRCPSCQGEWRSLGFVFSDGAYLRRLACQDCGHKRDDAKARFRVIDGGRPPPASTLGDGDVEAIEIIAHLMGSGGLSLREMDVSDVPISQFVQEHGSPLSCLRGFAFPAFCWPLERGDDYTVWLVVIDQGRKRISFRTRRRRGVGFPR